MQSTRSDLSGLDKGAEGASLEQAKPDETLRQKDPVPESLWKVRPAIAGTIPTVKVI